MLKNITHKSCFSRNINLLREKKGFSLLEVLIAMCLLAVAIMGMATLQSRGIRGNDLGNRTTQAVALAQDKLEELINTSRSTSLAAGTTPDSSNPIDETGGAGGIFTRTWTINDGTPVANAQSIDVTVNWTDVVGPHRVTVSGVITSDAY
jgi:prepilin-type N-terminal cleavage/methylation domain-containing protein